MSENMKRYLELGAPQEIKHGEYVARLVGIQQLNDGYVTGIYRFPGGECCPSEAPMVKL